MTREEIIDTMLGEEPFHIFRTIQLGGNFRQLRSLEDVEQISSETRHPGQYRQRNWYLTDAQWYRHHDDIHGREIIAPDPNVETPADDRPTLTQGRF